MVNPVPDGCHSVTPYLIVDGATGAIEFYKKAFGATELMRFPHGDRIAHAEIKIGDSHVMLADANPAMGYRAPQDGAPPPVSLMVYLSDVDTVFSRAISAGGTVERAVQNQFYGDRTGTLIDPYGHRWTLATHVEDVSAAEMERRMAELSAQPA